MEKVSVIVPVYNVEKYLKKCLESILNQTYKNLEIICINDGSTDRSLKICEEIGKKDSRIKIVNQKNKGLAAVRNRGIQEATSDYLAFVDSDDYIDNDFIEKLYKCLIQNNTDISVANVCIENTEQDRFLLSDDYELKSPLNRKEAMREFLNPDGGLGNYIWNKLYKKNAFDGIAFPENKLFEDAYTMYRILDNVNSVAVEKNTSYHYYVRKGSITSNYEEKFDNYDLLNANLEKAHFICGKYPELVDLAFHQYFSAFLWLTNLSAINEIDNNKKLMSYVKDLKCLKRTYNIKLCSFKEKVTFYMIKWNLNVYRFLYRIIKNKRRKKIKEKVILK